MSEGLKITLTAVTGVAVFVVGQVIQKLFIEPIQEHRRAIAKLIYVLKYYSSWSQGITVEGMREAQLEIIDAASNLYGTISAIPFYRTLAFFGLVPKQQKIERISSALETLARNASNDKFKICYQSVLTILKE